ncbi:MAG: 4-hydroxy-tetrahydrodipicolinate reductase [Candidatus Dadabacteria bacterium]
MRIAIVGYGKMGHMVEEIATSRGHEIVLRINIENTEDYTKENISKADVAIEFTGPDSAYDDVKKSIDFGVPIVSGSTGWNNKLDEMRNYCKGKNGSFLHTSNFSIGVNIFFEVNKLLARLMADKPDYSVSIKEVHHTQKKDSPSGTAVSLAEQVMENISSKKEWVNHETSDIDKIGITSERIDPAAGTHYVKYSSDIDDIEIIHTAHNRKGFALGAVLAAEFIHDKKGVFTMADVLKL